MDKIRKKITHVFKDNSFSIDFLEVRFNLRNESHKPYKKQNDELKYIYVLSNLPRQILKQLPTTISGRLSRNSSSELLFNESKHQYKEALRKNGFKSEIYYKDSSSPTNKKRSAGKEKLSGSTFRIIKMCQQISPNFFLKVVDKLFPRTHGLHKIFNRNSIKVSYRCMSNVQQLIKKHNNFIKNK